MVRKKILFRFIVKFALTKNRSRSPRMTDSGPMNDFKLSLINLLGSRMEIYRSHFCGDF